MDTVESLLKQYINGQMSVDQFLEALSPILVRIRDEWFQAFDRQPELKQAERAAYADYQSGNLSKDALFSRLVAIGQQLEGCEVLPYSTEEKVLSQLFGDMNAYEPDPDVRAVYQISEEELRELCKDALKVLQIG